MKEVWLERFFSSQDAERIADDIAQVGQRLARVRDVLGTIIFGQERVIEETIVTLLAGGHGLLIGMPGLAKTKLIASLATVFGLSSRRVQFTPDLMPADILGSEVLEEGGDGRRKFRFIEGPIFCQLLMADEINRASPRTQSALLQAMQEHTISVAGHLRPLPGPFHVFATQNPIEQEGTYPLPEAQLDRFLLNISVDYPDWAAERTMLIATTGATETPLETILADGELARLQSLTRRLPVGDKVVDGVLHLVRSGRPETSDLDLVRRSVAWGPGPRASQALLLAARARALLQGRLSPSLEDVAILAPPVLRHRFALGFAARAEGVSVTEILTLLLQKLA